MRDPAFVLCVECADAECGGTDADPQQSMELRRSAGMRQERDTPMTKIRWRASRFGT
ncbi:hypothetical protein FM105_00210 [Brevibacterium yomogidense]|uniref:Uncharacterized protein n=1 Tax=Brevibacterium yomogidense TaxID=946573 RepID=A0A1X6WTL2_9MICO|nr:hypothetical protein FM105_00210 [Brevibacterium yomogidense]